MSKLIDLFYAEDLAEHRLNVRFFIVRQLFEPLTGQCNESNAVADPDDIAISILGLRAARHKFSIEAQESLDCLASTARRSITG